jgi:hypothetical protein
VFTGQGVQDKGQITKDCGTRVAGICMNELQKGVFSQLLDYPRPLADTKYIFLKRKKNCGERDEVR